MTIGAEKTITAKEKIEEYRNIWERRTHAPELKTSHSAEIWDERSVEWAAKLAIDTEQTGGVYTRARCSAEILRERHILTPETVVADIGCGPGISTLEFAKTAKSATGFDFSAKFVEYARQTAASSFQTNASFEVCDFIALEVAKAEFTGKFDLVYASITPAASGDGCIDKIMRMSRRYCAVLSFAYTDKDTYDMRFNGEGLNALWNFLWYSGYYPETRFFADNRNTRYGLTMWDVTDREER